MSLSLSLSWIAIGDLCRGTHVSFERNFWLSDANSWLVDGNHLSFSYDNPIDTLCRTKIVLNNDVVCWSNTCFHFGCWTIAFWRKLNAAVAEAHDLRWFELRRKFSYRICSVLANLPQKWRGLIIKSSLESDIFQLKILLFFLTHEAEGIQIKNNFRKCVFKRILK